MAANLPPNHNFCDFTYTLQPNRGLIPFILLPAVEQAFELAYQDKLA